MELNQKQIEIKKKIESLVEILEIDINWALSVAMVESSLGLHMKSPTGCRGVFHMSGIAMRDLLYEMERDPIIGIVCGMAFMRLLLKRWKTMGKATIHFCDPADRDFYLDRVANYMSEFEALNGGA